MIVISYTRFSSSRQAKGDSYRRQTQSAQDWCSSHVPPLVLDETFNFQDLGVSGFTGANIKKGSELSKLVHLAKSGVLGEGDIVLVESLDRLSRLPILEAFNLIQSLTDCGLRIITLQDDREYNKTNLRRLVLLCHKLSISLTQLQ